MMMKTTRIAIVCALCVCAGVGCGKKDVETPDPAEQGVPMEKTGNVVLDNMANEEVP